MIGDISPQTVRITQQAVVYPGRDHVTKLRVERFDGRSYKPVDMTAVTRVILSFPEASPVIVYDSALQAVFTHVGAELTVDLSDYAMPASVLNCQIILFDAQHPAGQVLVDDIDTTVQFDFRNISTTGGTPPPAVEYLADAPSDGVTYARRDGVWVPVDALVSGVSSINSKTGVVVLTAADVGAETAGAVAAHVAQADPHPQYLTPAEANLAYDALGAGAAVVASHVAQADPHTQYTASLNDLMLGTMTTGLVAHNNGPFLVALDATTLRINAMPSVFFSGLVGTLGAAVIDLPQQDILLSAISFPTDGVYIRFVGQTAGGSVSFQSEAVNNDPLRVQLGIVYIKRVGGVNAFLDGVVGPRNVRTLPILSNVSYTDRAFHVLRSTVGLEPNINLTMKRSAGHVNGEAINWGDPIDVNTVEVPAADPMSFLLLSASAITSGVLPAPVTVFDPTQYWNGTALTPLTAASKASVQRVLITIAGAMVVQYGEAEYASLTDAAAAMFVAPFTRLFDDVLAVEIARVAVTKNCTNLKDANNARVVLIGLGAAGASSSGGTGTVDSVNGQTGTVVLTAADVGADASGTASAAVAAHVGAPDPHPQYLTPDEGDLAYTPASHVGTGGGAHATVVSNGAAGFMTGTDKAKLDGIAAGAQVNVPTDLSMGTITGTTIPLNSSTGTDVVLPAATVSAAGLQTAADKTKLDGIASGATANATNAELRDRQTHTGTQLSTTISDFTEATQDVIGAAITAGTNITVSYNDTTGLTTINATGGGGASLPVVQAFTGAKTLALADINTYNVSQDATAQNVTLPAQATVEWTADAEIHIEQGGVGAVTITGAAGVTINGVVAGSFTLSGKNSVATLKRTAANAWTLVGGVVAGGSASKITLGAPQNTTSGAFRDFPGVPAWANRVSLVLSGVSTSGVSNMRVQIGSGAVETTGYAGSFVNVAAGSSGSVLSTTAGFDIGTPSAGNTFSGKVTLDRLSGNTWVSSGVLGGATTGYGWNSAGSKTLAGALDLVRLTTVAGTDTFDAGIANITWE